MKKSCLVFALIITTTVCRGATVDWGVAVFTQFGDEAVLGVKSNLLPEPNYVHTGVFCYFIEEPWPKVTISAHSALLLSDTRWRLMQDGDWVNSSTTTPGSCDFFAGHGYDDFAWKQDIVLGYGESVYLGFVISSGSDFYGWVELGWDERGITVWDSAMDIDGAPIKIGSIPEPSSAFLVLSGLAVLCLRRRKIHRGFL